MTNLHTSEYIKDLEFVVVTSPGRRSGTTLLMRLMNNSENGIILGENACASVIYLMQYAVHHAYTFGPGTPFYNTMMDETLKGNNVHWVPDLMPHVEFYSEKLKASCFAMLEHYNDWCIEKGRPAWGIKQPNIEIANFHLMNMEMPKVKFIYLTRDLKDVAKSAKAYKMFNEEEDLKNFTEAYVNHINQVRGLPFQDAIHYVAFEDLISNTDEVIKGIEDFTGFKGIDKSLMEIKVNMFITDEQGKGETTYVPPAELDEEQERLVNRALKALKDPVA